MPAFDPNRKFCPVCHTSWEGPLIPPEHRHLYEAGSDHFSRLIGGETPDYDGVGFWQCPDCGAEWNRWTGKLTSFGSKA